MTLTLTERKYFKPYDSLGKSSRWQTDVVANDIAALVSGCGLRCNVTSDDEESLVSWSTHRMQFWIGIECIDTQAPTFQLNIGAGKRVMFLFARSFPDSAFANEPWLAQLRKFASEEVTRPTWDAEPEASGGSTHVKPILHIRDGLWGNLATIVFLLGLATLAVWFDRYSHGTVSIFIWLFAAVFVLICYIPLSYIRNPKARTLLIEGNQLVWRVRDKEGASVREGRLQLREIRTLQFVIPRDAVARQSRLLSCAALYFITPQGVKHELPLEFFPGVHRGRIVAAVREHVPNVQVEEVPDAA